MGHLMPPSRQRFQDFNSYILNIPDPPTGRVGPVSGYIDGMALEVVDVLLRDFHNAAYDERVTQRLDENPSACGHFVNHSSLAANANVRVVPFAWEDIVPNFQFGDEATFDLPNIARKDGAPHFMYSHGSVMIFYDTGGLSFSVKGVGGAALCAMEDLDEGQELLRDYDLEEPMPRWAADWYTLPPSDSDCDSDDDETQDEDAWRLIP